MTEAATIAADVLAGRRDPVEVTRMHLARIERDNGMLNALVRVDPPRAIADAEHVVQRLAQGEQLPLAGVPVIVKDNIWVRDRNISQGSHLFADFVAPSDAIAVERVRNAGAVIIGIGNCPEFACKGQTNSPLHGTTRNPLDPALTAGGSSGGNAAALAAGFAPLALGTDAGGSGRRPAAHTGTVGFKPSFGAIPYGPGFPEPFWGISVVAPMARTVADCVLLFGVIAGPDARDAEAIHIEPRSAARPARALRIGYAPRLGLDVPVDHDVADAIEIGVEALRRAGWAIARTDPSWPAGLREDALMPLQAAGLAALHGAAFRANPQRFDPDVGAQIERGFAVSGAEVAAALDASSAIRRAAAAFLADVDLLVCPTTPCVAWPVDRLGPSHIGGIEVAARGHAVFTPFFNHALTPAISIPSGHGRDGLPVGLQLIARRGADWQVLEAAKGAEMILAQLNAKKAQAS